MSALRLQSKHPRTEGVESGTTELGEIRFAHDLNNLLMVVIGAVEALSENLETGTANQQLALAGLQAAECGAGLVRRLLEPAKPPAGSSLIVDCAEVVASLRPLTANLLAENIVLAASAPPHPLTCLANKAELQSALLNLCINARDAMPGGGAIILRADRRWLEGAAADHLGLASGSYVVFTISDTGSGMSPQTLRRATEPFFTTKGEAGTGLGLSSVETFARKLGGALSIASRLDFGTTAQIYLPRAPTATGPRPRLIDLQPQRNP